MLFTKSTTLNDIAIFKRELDKSERQREQLSDHLEVLFILFNKKTKFFFFFLIQILVKKCDEKEKLVARTLLELKEVTENCDTYERQNTKLQRDLTLALEKLEEMTQEAERYAQEASNSQKQFSDSEQKREEFKIQAQETVKQLNLSFKFSFFLKFYFLDGKLKLKNLKKMLIDINLVQHKCQNETNN